MTLSRQFQPHIPAFTALFFFFTGLAHSQTTVLWSDPIAVAESGIGTASSRIALTPAGDPIVLWGQGGTTPAIRVARWENGSFLAPQELNTTGFLPGIYDFGGLDLAVQGNSVFVVFENIISGIYMLRSTDGGHNFEAPITVYKPAPGRIVTLPSVAADGDGNPLISYLFEASNETNAVYHLARSTDGGLSFEPPVNASEPADGDFVCECCPSDISIRGDSVWLIYRNLRPGNIRDIWVSNSSNQGVHFDSAMDVDDTDWVQNVCPISGPCMRISGDTIVSAWMSRGAGSTLVHVSVASISSGLASPSFGFPRISNFGTQNRPDIAGNADTLGLVWEESGIPGTGTDILFAFSTTGGSALPQQVINLTQATGTQKTPSMTYQNGVFHLVYADIITNQLWYRKGTVRGASSTSTPVQLATLQVFPNPASKSIRINWSAAGSNPQQFQLVNAQGQISRRWENVASGQSLSLENLSPGWYILRSPETNFATEKILIQAHR